MRTTPASAKAPAQPGAKSNLFTIGYEGKTQDELLELLKASGVKRLLDVRYNALSRKPGFTKQKLADGCAKQGIEYVHLRELGVPSDMRPDRTKPQSVQQFLRRYCDEILPQAPDELAQACALVQERPTALLCFEQDIACCHRGPLSARLAELTGLSVKHL